MPPLFANGLFTHDVSVHACKAAVLTAGNYFTVPFNSFSIWRANHAKVARKKGTVLDFIALFFSLIWSQVGALERRECSKIVAYINSFL